MLLLSFHPCLSGGLPAASSGPGSNVCQSQQGFSSKTVEGESTSVVFFTFGIRIEFGTQTPTKHASKKRKKNKTKQNVCYVKMQSQAMSTLSIIKFHLIRHVLFFESEMYTIYFWLLNFIFPKIQDAGLIFEFRGLRFGFTILNLPKLNDFYIRFGSCDSKPAENFL